MTNQPPTYDATWDALYAQRRYQYAPWDHVVSFLFRNAPKHKPREDIRILELGCGAASNLFFAAQQGFSVYGIDAAATAILKARERFNDAGLIARLEIGDFTSLPFAEAYFDLVIDRAAITCASFDGAKACTAEVARVITPGGRFFFNPYSDRSSSAASGKRLDTIGGEIPGGLRADIAEGTLVGVGQIYFYSLSDIAALLPEYEWKTLEVKHMEWFDLLAPYRDMHAEYRVVVEKKQP